MQEPVLSFPALAIVVAIMASAATFRGFTGFGLALVSMPFLILVVPPQRAIIVVLVVQLTMGLLDSRECLKWADRRAVAALSAAALVGTPMGYFAIGFMPLWLAQIVIGSITAGAAFSLFFKVAFRDELGLAKTAAVGFVSGLFGGLAAAPGPPIVAYFLARPISARSKRASMIMFFAISALIAILTAAAQNTLHVDVFMLGLVATPFCYAGSWLGAQFFRRGSDGLYRIVALCVLELSAALSISLGLAALLGGA